VFEDVPQQIEVLNHRGENLTTKRAREKKFSRRKTFLVTDETRMELSQSSGLPFL
jgi:hypothetical protein